MGYPFSILIDPPAPTYPEYPQLLAEANRTAPRFVHPRNLDPSREVVARRGTDWRIAVLGRPNGSAFNGGYTMVDHQLLILADQANVDPPLPEWIVEGRAEGKRVKAERDRRKQEQRDRDAAAWKAALDAATVDGLAVRMASRARARRGQWVFLGHAVAATDVYSGSGSKVRTHKAGRALCETEHRARPLLLGGETDAPATCERCVYWTSRVRNQR